MAEYYRTCRCGCGSFIATRSTQWFKTTTCYQKWQRDTYQSVRVVEARNCRKCGKQFTTRHKKHIYCEGCTRTVVRSIPANIKVSFLDSTLSGKVVVSIVNGKVEGISNA